MQIIFQQRNPDLTNPKVLGPLGVEKNNSRLQQKDHKICTYWNQMKAGVKTLLATCKVGIKFPDAVDSWEILLLQTPEALSELSSIREMQSLLFSPLSLKIAVWCSHFHMAIRIMFLLPGSIWLVGSHRYWADMLKLLFLGAVAKELCQKSDGQWWCSSTYRQTENKQVTGSGWQPPGISFF